jgi:hypothetical protein
MPHLQGLARLVAADMIGMGGSDKLSPCGPDRYTYAEQRDYLFALWDALDLGDNVTRVLHDFQPSEARCWAVVARNHGSIWAVTFAQTGFSGIPWPVFSRVTMVAPIASASA